MTLSSVSVPANQSEEMPEKTAQTRLRSFIYLPKEGLQGEDIPSHILWKNARAEYAKISFQPPLKFKEIFNVKEYEVHDNEISIKKVEMEGYIGLSFESSKASELEAVVPVEYSVYLSNGDVIKELKEIKLFKPQLKVVLPTEKEIKIDPKTLFVKGRIRIKNVGRGVLIMNISATEDSTAQIETPPQHREFAEKFLSDILEEMSDLAKRFHQFQPVLDEMRKWETRNLLELSAQQRDQFLEYVNRTAKVLASDRDLLQAFVNAYGKAFARNSEFIEAVRRIVTLYESLVSKDLLLINPVDEITIKDAEVKISLKISQTDKVFDLYEDVVLPRIKLKSPGEVNVPIYKLFEWEK